MGNDGGSIPTRDELVKTAKKPEQKDKDSERMFRWRHCAMTQEPLSKHVVACELGRMYNKEAIIHRLLDKTSKEQLPAAIRHIKSIKDVKSLELTPNRAFKDGKSFGDGFMDKSISPWICPVMGLEMNGHFKFVYDWSNGKVLSERAFKMVKNDDAVKIKEENMIILNPEVGDEADLMASKMEARRARVKAEKKAKKEKSKILETPSSSSSGNTPPEEETEGPTKAKKAKLPPPPQQETKLKKKTSSSVQDDKSKSEIFKSLFSSHKTAQNQPKGHWVTFDPRYN